VPRAWPDGFHCSGIAFQWIKTGQRLAKQLPLFMIADNKNFPMGLGHTTRKGAEISLLIGGRQFQSPEHRRARSNLCAARIAQLLAAWGENWRG
jgi:hypothetical protein